jgi:CDGSH-type Zn-finger protein
MPVCICGFSTSMPSCNGSHRIVKAVRESVANDIENDPELDQDTKVRLAGIIRKSKRGY